MNAFSEQLSAARKGQFDAQLEFARSLTAQAFATAEQVLALNISTSRAQVERTASTFRRLLSISDPRDLFTLGSTTQDQLSSMLEYGRELFNIVTDARLNLSRSAGEMPAPQPETEQAAAPAAAEPQQKAPSKPVAVADSQAAAELPAKAKPIAKAVRKVAGKRGAAKPSASPIAIEAVLDPKPQMEAGAAVVQLKPATARKARKK
ncbi:phasin family protein [Massilia solisilvae]|uniref:Phasin family protein n=1 Tax=Massilia solisilvae TaxID=1811225 RepID=A0ABT2BE93_9BURK|nr:phasin family protein [Massilia solisilvae]MCS0606838.1 phasin family protein [Massilia solisilvae]